MKQLLVRAIVFLWDGEAGGFDLAGMRNCEYGVRILQYR